MRLATTSQVSETRRPVADDVLRSHGGLREPRRGTLDDHPKFITGSVLAIDGGYTAR